MKLRRVVQLLFLALFAVLIALTTFPLQAKLPVDLFLRLDPLLLLGASIAARTVVSGLFAAFVMLALTALLGRFFCGWICPLGTTIELTDDLLCRRRKRRWPNAQRVGRGLKYVNLIVILIAAAFGYGLTFLLDPIALFTRAATYLLHPAAMLLANAGLDILRPVALKADWVKLYYAELHQPLFSSGSLAAAIVFLTILMLNRLQRRFWCRSLCPLGAMLGFFARFSPVRRQVGAACDHDGKCKRTCETGAIFDDEVQYDPAECILCWNCVDDCHLGVTTFRFASPLPRLAQPLDIGRRRFLVGLAGGAFGALLFRSNPARAARPDKLLRPPAALPEDDFLKRCIRCGQCVKACPTNTLQPDWGEGGLEGLWAPHHQMRLAGCDQGCNVCGQVCPTGALRDVPLYQKRYAKLGTAIIDQQRCVVWAADKFCLVCDEACPYNAIYFAENEQGKRRPYVDRRHCNGCGLCESVCPVDGQGAINVYPDEQIRLSQGDYADEARRRGFLFERGVAEDKILPVGDGGEAYGD
ncbi:MAG TPA: 4Fe-4S dicluster domain-containing protein [bacterium]|nr:4Fe-4S dicluster domain-containing protein [bacterium]